jgi:hypothetical protein
MRTQWKPGRHSLDERVREHVSGYDVRDELMTEFNDVAAGIVRQVRTVIEKSLTGKLKNAFDLIEKADLKRIEATIVAAFSERQMGLRELASLARKELAMLIIKRAIPKYRVGSDGADPLEYFRQFYKEPFTRFDVPANGINSIDPNLHARLKKSGRLSGVSDVLNHG